MNVWQAILQDLKVGKKVALLFVLQSQGSSPGRQGFKMKVNEDGTMAGSIGGGVMEHKLVELAKAMLHQDFQPFLKQQIHRRDADQHQSGMICSGEQTVALYFLKPSQKEVIQSIIDSLSLHKTGVLSLSDQGISFDEDQTKISASSLMLEEGTWHYQELLGFKDHIFIVGAGHVGLALSRIMAQLGFYVTVLDNREELNTMRQNDYAHQCQVIDYENIASFIPEGSDTYVVIMTFGYRPDKRILQQLLGNKFKYLGMLGSGTKVRQLLNELRSEGFDAKALAHLHSPIGLKIGSQTPEEIAVSIAAEIISVKNNK